jgi:hypothetical protein
VYGEVTGLMEREPTTVQAEYLAANPDGERVYRYLRRYHVGAGNALPRDVAPKLFNLADRRVRDLVSELGTRGFPITANPEGGYFYAQTGAELEPSCLVLESRAKAEGARARGLRQAQGNLEASRAFGRAVMAITHKKPLPEGQQLLGAAR